MNGHIAYGYNHIYLLYLVVNLKFIFEKSYRESCNCCCRLISHSKVDIFMVNGECLTYKISTYTHFQVCLDKLEMKILDLAVVIFSFTFQVN